MKTFMQEYGLIVVSAIVIMLFVAIASPIGNGLSDGVQAVVEKFTESMNENDGSDVAKGAGLCAPDGTFTSWDDLVADGVVGVSDGFCRAIDKSISGSLVIPDGVTGISSFAFRGCTNLTNITIPDSVTYIGGLAFSSCGVEDLTIPDSVVYIDEDAFLWVPHINYNGPFLEDNWNAPWGAGSMN